MHCGTNLVASFNNWWWNKDPLPIIATRTLMVKLRTINKALPGDSPDYHIYFPFNKSKSMFQEIVLLRVFLVANHSRWRSKRTTDMRHLWTWATSTTKPWNVLVKERLRKVIWTPHTWVLLPCNANSKYGGGTWVSQVSSFHTNSYHGLEIVLALAPCS